MNIIPLIERECKHKDKKVVRREVFEDYLITAIDLCKKCVNELDLTEDIECVDKDVIPRKKLQTKAQIKKEVSKPKDELDSLRKYKDQLWNIDDVIKKAQTIIILYCS